MRQASHCARLRYGVQEFDEPIECAIRQVAKRGYIASTVRIEQGRLKVVWANRLTSTGMILEGQESPGCFVLLG